MTTTKLILFRHDANGTVQRIEDEVVVEEPLGIRVAGQSVAVTMRTPGHDEELVAGFLFSEGLIHEPSEIRAITRCPQADAGEVLEVHLVRPSADWGDRLRRNFFLSSSCGICGKASIEQVHATIPPLDHPGPNISAGLLVSLPGRLRESQVTFSRTGGLHAAALFDAAGSLLLVREDVGRHNAVDKVLGARLLAGQATTEDGILVVSGRASFEILQKSLAGRIPIICAVSAPSSLAIEFARESGQTLVGFLRDGRFNLYAGAERIRSDPA